MKIVRTAFLSAFLALYQSVAAWDISSSDAAAPENPISEHETLAKTWTVSGANAVDVISLRTFGLVFVEYDASLASSESPVVAKVVISGDNADLLDAFEVVDDKDNANGVIVRFRNVDLDTQGYLLTRVAVSNKQAVSAISQVFSSDLVVGDDVVVQNDPEGNVSVALVGSGNIYFGSPATEFSLAQLNVALVGSGDLQVLAKSIDVSGTLNLVVAGSGDAAVVADSVSVNDTLAIAVAGSGDAYVQSEHVSSFNLSTVVAGSGSATFSRAGACQQQDISIVGSGDVESGSIQCVDTQVHLAGSGDVLVQTSGTLNVTTIFGSGNVKYYGTKPTVVNVEKGLDFFGHGKKSKVKQAKKNHYQEFEVEPAPAKELVYVQIKVTKSSSESEDVQIHELTESGGPAGPVRFHAQNVQPPATQSAVAMAATTGGQTHFFGIFTVVGVAFAAVGAVAVKYKRRTERARYQSLV